MARWLPSGRASVRLVNERNRRVIAGVAELALSRRARRLGLLGRSGIDVDAALILARCFAVHTAGMRFPIDVLFVDRYGRALRTAHALKPWRAAVSVRAYAVIELAAGVLERHDVKVGDRLLLC